MKEVRAAVCQANERNNPDITGTPTGERNSHELSLLAQEESCKITLINA